MYGLFFICHPHPSDNEVNRYPLKWNTIVQKEIVGILVVSNGVSIKEKDLEKKTVTFTNWVSEKQKKKTNFEKRKMQHSGFFQQCNG